MNLHACRSRSWLIPGVAVVLSAIYGIAYFTAPRPAASAADVDRQSPPPSLTSVTTFKVYPGDCNDMDILFGGKTLAEFDRAAGVAVRRFISADPRLRSVTASCSAKFVAAGRRGDLVTVYATVTRAEEADVVVAVSLWRERPDGQDCLATGEYRFVTVDELFKKLPHNMKAPGEPPLAIPAPERLHEPKKEE